MSEKKWYTYLLCYPDSEEPFYAGKGTGNRMLVHEMMLDNPLDTNEEKKEIIRGILAQGKQVFKKKVAEFDNEIDAYAHEIELIKLYRPQLTNKQRGGGGAAYGESIASEQTLYVEVRKEDLDERWVIDRARYENIHEFYWNTHFALEAASDPKSFRSKIGAFLKTWYEEKCQKLGLEPDQGILWIMEVSRFIPGMSM